MPTTGDTFSCWRRLPKIRRRSSSNKAGVGFLTRLLVPDGNAPEAAAVDGLRVFPPRNLRESWESLTDNKLIPSFTQAADEFLPARVHRWTALRPPFPARQSRQPL